MRTSFRGVRQVPELRATNRFLAEIMSAARKAKARTRRGARWNRGELKLLGKVPDSVLARRYRRTIKEVSAMRESRGIALPTGPRRWTSPEILLLGTKTDRDVAQHLRRTRGAVAYRRRSLDIPAFKPRPEFKYWSREEIR